MKILFLGENSSPIFKWLKINGENVLSKSDQISYEYCKNNKFDFLISYGYRHIIKKKILNYFKNKAINLHISYLPYNRGADPNFWSFIENTPKGVTIHLIDEGIDTGDIIIQKEIFIDSYKNTLRTSYEKLNYEIQNLFYENWGKIKKNKIKSKKQLGKGTFNKLNDKQNYIHFIEKLGWNTRCCDLEKNKI